MVLAENNIKDWVASYTDTLYSWAFYKLSDEELAKDMVQETFIAAHQKMSSFDGKSKPKTWLFSILKHKIIDHYRKQFRNPVEMRYKNNADFFDEDGMWLEEKRPKEWETEPHLLDNTDFLKVLDDCFGKLPGQWASAIQLKYLSGKEGEEVCKELNISSSNYWQIVHRAKLNLRQCLELNWFK